MSAGCSGMSRGAFVRHNLRVQQDSVDIKLESNYENIFHTHYFTAPSVSGVIEPQFSVALTGKLRPWAEGSARDTATVDRREVWMSVVFGSCLDGSGLAAHGGRPPLDLMLVIDISGSMSTAFSGDSSQRAADAASQLANGKAGMQQPRIESSSKLEVALQCLDSLLSQLRGDDVLGVLVFNNTCRVLLPLQPWRSVDVSQLRRNLVALSATGGTELGVALSAATNAFPVFENSRIDATPSPSNSTMSPSWRQRSRRIMFVTDLEADGEEFIRVAARNAMGLPQSADDNELAHAQSLFVSDEAYRKEVLKKAIYMSVVGLDVKFTSKILAALHGVRGVTCSTVASSAAFVRLTTEEFSHLVTPIAMDVTVQLTLPNDSSGSQWQLQRAYGNSELNSMSPGGPARMATMFPSPVNTRGRQLGGLILFQLAPRTSAPDSTVASRAAATSNSLYVNCTYFDLDGVMHSQCYMLSLPTLYSSSSSSLPLPSLSWTSCSSSSSSDALSPAVSNSFSSADIHRAWCLVQYIDFCETFQSLREWKTASCGLLQPFRRWLHQQANSIMAAQLSEQKGAEGASTAELMDEKERLAQWAEACGVPRDLKMNETQAQHGPSAAPAANGQIVKSAQLPHTALLTVTATTQMSQAPAAAAALPDAAQASATVTDCKNIALPSTSAPAGSSAAPHGSDSQCCAVCLIPERARNTLLLPCRHLCVCSVCAANPDGLKVCPLCRQPVVHQLTVFV